MMTLEQFSQIATIASAVAAIVGLGGIWWQIRSSQRSVAETAANELYANLVKTAMEFPQFVAPEDREINLKTEKFRNSRDEFRRYESFVDLMLGTIEAMTPEHGPQGATAQANSYLVSWIAAHRKYLKSDYYQGVFGDQLPTKIAPIFAKAFGER